MLVVNKKRDSNLELFRIIVMMLIVSHHYVVNSGLISEVLPNEPISVKSIFYYLFGAWGKTGINCFVLITGYFMCTSTISLRKYTKLIFEVLFYNLICSIIFALVYPNDFSALKFLYSICPIQGVRDGFTSCFIIFYLFIPFLNILIKNIDKLTHLKLIGLCLLVYTIIGTTPLPMSMNYITWFCVLYVIASYMRFYSPSPYLLLGHVSKRYSIIISDVGCWGIATAISVLLSILSIVFCLYAGEYMNEFLPFYFVSDCNKILALATGVTSFMFFKNLKIGYNKFINTIGASTFGVLLIHANSNAMRQWLWRDTFNNIHWFDSNLYWLHALLSVLIIFSVCVCIDVFRIKVIETPMFRYLDKRIQNGKYSQLWFNN